MTEITICDSADRREAEESIDILNHLHSHLASARQMAECLKDFLPEKGAEAEREIQGVMNDLCIPTTVKAIEAALSEYEEGPMPWSGGLLASEVI